MKREEVCRALFRALNTEETEEIVTLVLKEEEVLIQFADGTKYKIQIVQTEERF